MSYKKTIALDFDGVLNTYNGWKGEDELFQPRPGVNNFLAALAADFELKIYSTRSAEKIRTWLKVHGMDDLIADVCREKPMAIVYLDDRGLRFDGDFDAAYTAIKSFKAHWEWALIP